MNNTITQLFLKYILNQCSKAEIEQVISLIKDGHHDSEWLAAMELAEQENHFESNLSEAHKAKMYQGIRKAGHIKPTSNKRWWAYSAAAILLVASAGLWLQRSNKLSPPPQELAINNVQSKPIAKTGKKWVKLPDGTSVQLNNNSSIDYPDSFEGLKERKVTLVGEAYFDVKHEEAQPFVISTGKLTVTVLGTAFNIKSSADQSQITVTVTRGKVKVQKEGQTLGLLTQNQQLSWKANEVQPLLKQDHIDPKVAIAWKADDLIMDDVTLEEAANMLAKRYQLKVHFDNPALRQCKFTAAFLERNELTQMLNVIGDITNTKLTVNAQQTLTLSGAGCN